MLRSIYKLWGYKSVKFIKEYFEEFLKGNIKEKLSMIADLIQIISFVLAIILSPQIFSYFYNFNLDNYYQIVIATVFSIISILLFFILISIVVALKKYMYDGSTTTFKLFYVIMWVLFGGIGLAVLPPFIVFCYSVALQDMK